MLNLIKMDLYRMFHTVSTWVMCFVVIVVTAFAIFMTGVDLDAIKERGTVNEIEPGLQIEENEVNLNFGVYSNTKEEWITEDITLAGLLEAQLASGLFVIVSLIFVSIFVNADQKNGYIKNIAGQLPYKWMPVLSKAVAIMAQLLLQFAIMTITMYIGGKIAFGEQFVWGNTLDICKVLGGQYILHLGFDYLILCLCIVFKSVSLSMTLGILLSCKVVTLVYFGINQLVEAVLKTKDFDIGKYAIEMNISSFTTSAGAEDIARMLVIGVLYVLVTLILAAVVTQKRDVR